MGKRSDKPHTIAQYLGQLAIKEPSLDEKRNSLKVDGPHPDAPLRYEFDCGCIAAENEPFGLLYYLDTCSDEHYELFS